jgi:predicted ATPase
MKFWRSPMPDPRDRLQRKFEPEHRFPNFGGLIVRMRVCGFRCHRDTIIDIKSPITAFTGLNGTGKSTLLQLAATAYKDPDARQSFTIRDFMVRSVLDHEPYSVLASAQFDYWTEQRRTRLVTLSRNVSDNRWNGYRYRPLRKVFFAGIGLYLPKIEARDFLVQYARSFRVLGTTDVPEEAKNWTCRILGHSYDALVMNEVGFSSAFPVGKVISAVRRGCAYSETHMGFGEGRAQFMIHSLEALPDKSLVLLEEPETSLHQRAQHELGHYLVDVAIRKGHQILLTTHSEYLLSALPEASRIFLYPGERGIEQLCGITAVQANSLLTDGFDKALTILVEDDCAAAVLAEILDRADRHFRQTVHITWPAGKNEIVTTLRATQRARLRLAAVLDPDAPESQEYRQMFIFKLPGAQPPEREMLAAQAVKDYFQAQYGISIGDFLAANADADHHELFAQLEERTARSQAMLLGEAARIFVLTLPEPEVNTLVQQLKDAANR